MDVTTAYTTATAAFDTACYGMFTRMTTSIISTTRIISTAPTPRTRSDEGWQHRGRRGGTCASAFGNLRVFWKISVGSVLWVAMK
jgi:hypothetical protein